MYWLHYKVLTILGDFPDSIPINGRVFNFNGWEEIRLQLYKSRVTSFLDQKKKKRPPGACKIFIIFKLQELSWRELYNRKYVLCSVHLGSFQLGESHSNLKMFPSSLWLRTQITLEYDYVFLNCKIQTFLSSSLKGNIIYDTI